MSVRAIRGIWLFILMLSPAKGRCRTELMIHEAAGPPQVDTLSRPSLSWVIVSGL